VRRVAAVVLLILAAAGAGWMREDVARALVRASITFCG